MSFNSADLSQWVYSKLSGDTINHAWFIEALDDLNAHVRTPQLLAGALGLCGEAGEFTDIVKKMVFQGKECTEEVRNDMIKELGDVLFYLFVAMQALDVTLEDVVAKLQFKLDGRYPDGFSVEQSEVRS